MGKINNQCKLLKSVDIEKRIADIKKKIEEFEKELNILKDIKFTYIYPGSISDWEAGIVFIRADYFKEYAESLINKEAPPWIADNVYIESAAIDLQSDYYFIEFDGVGYWVKR